MTKSVITMQVTRLLQLADTLPRRGKDNKIRWNEISRQLNRNIMTCRNLYIAHRNKVMRHGDFTAEEDALILRRVSEWGDRGRGLWTSLEGEMNRPQDVIAGHYKIIRQLPTAPTTSCDSTATTVKLTPAKRKVPRTVGIGSISDDSSSCDELYGGRGDNIDDSDTDDECDGPSSSSASSAAALSWQLDTRRTKSVFIHWTHDMVSYTHPYMF